jgi:hypothetical protein
MTEQDNKPKTLQDHPGSEESMDDFHADQMRFPWLAVAITVVVLVAVLLLF